MDLTQKILVFSKYEYEECLKGPDAKKLMPIDEVPGNVEVGSIVARTIILEQVGAEPKGLSICFEE
ncbi:hypothetical protein FVEG_17273 [Fusarium verticillioides 7600]|uniref:Uncharacterized protein n=1 Tax=Gibberella moniliformis (strain M3125 / FGSC 7600) TaxID=334819 RepID=W7N202_GIBM7|nr:hypothetical protein FVEG_17273 [Fusarium verticillioides 7600]EWG54180.1 hypothetical protein FVEG_17273 [Fusarium verticillioides 7600]